VAPDLYDKFILTAGVIDCLSRDVVVNQAQVSGTHDDLNDDVALLNSPVANDDVTVVTEQNNVECDNVDEDF